HETNFLRFVRGQEADHPYALLITRVRAWLETALVAEDSLPPTKRAEAGRALGGWIEDTRPGVGINPETGWPDIRWSKKVEAGRYEIGEDSKAYESSKKKVAIKHPYCLSRYPITNAQFQCFIDAPDVGEPAWWEDIPDEEKRFSEPRFPYDNHPRETVSWYQAIAFCRWLSHKLGYEVDLPHQYEWEVAARYPDGRFYPWGNEFDNERANTNQDIGQTTAVGLYPSGRNAALDLYDLSGNVWEWCVNKYDEPEETAVDNSRRVLRGGSWYDDQNSARAAYRYDNFPGSRFSSYGFRVVVVRRPPSHLAL
ncbi:MAG: formylglycine-generating enzyme family protein, partial [Chloroflexi bacterium]|nr:formylglycine-generating enzyme family protein [Chloroflexota bacterium]